MIDSPVVRRGVAFAADGRNRRLVYIVLALILAVLCVFPRPWVARGKIVPDNASASALSSVFGALGGGRVQNFATLFGDRGTVEIALSIARSQSIADEVIQRERLVAPGSFDSLRAAQLALADRVKVYSLTGGMLEVQTRSSDPDWALRLTRAYLKTIAKRLADYGTEQNARKRRIVEDRMREAISRLARAEAELNAFKRINRLPDPEQELGAQLSLRTGLEGQLRAKLVQLASLSQTAGNENPALIVLETEIAALRRQIAAATQRSSSDTGLSASGISAISLQYANLFRQYTFAQNIYDIYSRSAEEVAVQDIVAQDVGQAALVDPPHVDVERYYNSWALALLGLLALGIFVGEFYGPATGMWRLSQRPATQ